MTTLTPLLPLTGILLLSATSLSGSSFPILLKYLPRLERPAAKLPGKKRELCNNNVRILDDFWEDRQKKKQLKSIIKLIPFEHCKRPRFHHGNLMVNVMKLDSIFSLVFIYTLYIHTYCS